jgi:hypothetical protein
MDVVAGRSAIRAAVRGCRASVAGSGRAVLAGVKFPEHLPQAPVHLLEYRRVLGHRQPVQLVEAGHRLVNPGLAGRLPLRRSNRAGRVG